MATKTFRAHHTTPANNNAVPGVITPNGDSTKQHTLQWNGFLGLTHDAGPNGSSVSFGYDAWARPSQTVSPHGAVTTYSYTNNPPTQTATTNGRWVRTTSDGLGRPIKVETGHGGTTVSITDTEYGPCACSPTGKVKRVSRPYAPGGTVYWTTYTYDALGRTVSVQLPNNSGTTTYAYAGNTVTTTDPAGKWKTFTMDSFGQLTKVTEPNPGGGRWDTNYAYSVFGQLTQVSMPRVAEQRRRPRSTIRTAGPPTTAQLH